AAFELGNQRGAPPHTGDRSNRLGAHRAAQTARAETPTATRIVIRRRFCGGRARSQLIVSQDNRKRMPNSVPGLKLPPDERIEANHSVKLLGVWTPGTLRPGRHLLPAARWLVASRGAHALRAGAPPPKNLRPAVGKVR